MSIDAIIIKTELLNFVVHPKYSTIEFILEIESGFIVHIVHLYMGLGMFGAFLHGIIGRRKDKSKTPEETIKEYIIFLCVCIINNI